MDSDALPHKSRQCAPKTAIEFKITDLINDCALLCLARQIHAQECLCLLNRGSLGEVHDIDRGPMSFDQLGKKLVQGLNYVTEVQWNRTLDRGDMGYVAVSAPS